MKILRYLNTSLVLALLAGIVLAAAYFFFGVEVAEAQGKVAPGNFVTCEGNTCNACNLVEMANTIIIWLFGIIFLIFAGLMAVAGIGLVTSGGNQSALEAAKSKFKNGIIGLLIVMSAWLIVDTIMKGLVGGGDTGQPMGEMKNWGPWAEIECVQQTTALAMTEPIATTEPPPQVPLVPGDVRFLMSSALNSNQNNHKSPALINYQSCLASNLLSGDYIITSVSDNQIASGAKTFAQCANGGCAHSANSCHYGGRTCVGSSYALDIRTTNLTPEQVTGFRAAVTTCGGYYKRHGPPDHIHTSIGAAAGCGCN